jgi:hypothetical protein
MIGLARVRKPSRLDLGSNQRRVNQGGTTSGSSSLDEEPLFVRSHVVVEQNMDRR